MANEDDSAPVAGTGKLDSETVQALIAHGFPQVDAELTEFAFRIHDLGRLIEYRIDEFLRREPINHSSFIVLITLRLRGCRLPFGVLSNQVLLTSGGFANAINRLEAQNLVVRQRDDGDARKTWIEITPEGSYLVDELMIRYIAQFAKRAQVLKPAQRRAIMDWTARSPVHAGG